MKKIGIFLDWFAGDYQYELVRGIEKEALKQNLDILYVVGKALQIPDNSGKEVDISGDKYDLHNIIYDFVNKNHIDGLLIPATIMSYVSEAEFGAFCSNYREVPVITLSVKVAGLPSVKIDNAGGFRQLLIHLIEKHNYKKMAFIEGAKSNPEAMQRLAVFKEVLAEYNLEFSDQLLLEDNHWGHSDGMKAVSVLMDQRGLAPGKDFEAVVASNDLMALGAIEEFERRKIGVPSQVAVTGYDDILEAGKTGVPLTTVKQSLESLGAEAVNLLLQRPEASTVLEIPSQLIVRKSCGCPHAVHQEEDSRGENDIAGSRILNRQYRDLTTIIGEIQARDDLNSLKVYLSKALPVLGIHKGSIFIYSNPEIPEKGFRFFSGFTSSSINWGEGYEEKILSFDDIYKIATSGGERNSTCILPLSFSGEHIGIAFFEVNLEAWYVYQVIHFHLSNRLKSSFLLIKIKEMNWELQKNHQQLIRQEKLASLGRMSSSIAHELKNPLNFIINFSALNLSSLEELLELCSDSLKNAHESVHSKLNSIITEIMENSSEINKNGHRLNHIVKTMLNQALLDSKSMEEYYLHNLLKESLDNIQVKEHYRDLKVFLREEYEPKSIKIQGRKADLITAFEHVIDNAFYAMKQRGKSEQGYKPHLLISTALFNNYPVIKIQDNGTGMNQEIVDHIFEPFFTTKPPGEGIGMGLKMCHEIIVEGCGGEIRCKTGINEGTTLEIGLKKDLQ